MFDQITIIGMGLLGGSIGIGCLQRGLARKVVAVVRRESAVDEVKNKSAAHRTTLDITEGVREAEIIVFAVPIPAIAPLAEKIAGAVPKGSIVTDVGSVKSSVVENLERILGDRCRVVGSHPMAGSEKSGIAIADPAIFQDNVCVVTPTEKTDKKALERVTKFWEALGMRVKNATPQQHDENVALISHLPHVAAFALMNTIKNNSCDPQDVIEFAGPGFRDVTRIAAASPELWTGICFDNKQMVLETIRAYQQELSAFAQAFGDDNADDLCRLFAEAKALKDASGEVLED